MSYIKVKKSKVKKVAVSYRLRPDVFKKLQKLANYYDFSNTTMLEVLVIHAASCSRKNLEEVVLKAKLSEIHNSAKRIEEQLNKVNSKGAVA